MFEDRIAALNQANIEKMAMGAMQDVYKRQILRNI